MDPICINASCSYAYLASYKPSYIDVSYKCKLRIYVAIAMQLVLYSHIATPLGYILAICIIGVNFMHE